MRAWILLLAACGRSEPPPPPSVPIAVAVPVDAAGVSNCELLPFEPSTPVPEASGAAWLTIASPAVPGEAAPPNGGAASIAGALRLVVVSDSGNHGAYGVIDPETGKTLEQGLLPLNGSTDDIEGLAVRGDRLIGITSPGWILEWKRSDKGFALVAGPYPLGPVDLPPRGGLGDKPPKGNGMVCDGTRSNCGRNYEGICLTEHGGYVASKADGHLYPVTGDDKLVVHREGAIAVADPGHLADCAYDGDQLYVGNNLFGLSSVARVVDGKTVAIASLGIGFPEVLAVRGDLFYRMSDTGGAPSLMSKFRCSASAR